MSSNVKENIIKAVRERKAIWDSTNKHHQNKYVVNNCWHEIAKIVDLPAGEVSKQWKGLRQEFTKQWQKAIFHMPPDTPIEEITTRWPYFNSMRFLIEQIESQKGDKSIFISAKDNADSQLYGDGANTIKMEPSADDDLIAGDFQEYISMPGSAPSEFDIRSVDADYENHAAKKPKLEESYDENDEDIGFFNSLLPHVKKLSPKNKLIFRMKSQNMLFDLLYGDKSDDKNSNTGCPNSNLNTTHAPNL